MSLTARVAGIEPPTLDASTFPDCVEESTADNTHALESAGRYHIQNGTREHQVTSSSSSPTGSRPATVTRTTEMACPSASPRASRPPSERPLTRKRKKQWLTAPTVEQTAVLDGFRDRTSGHAAFKRLPRV